MDLPECELFSFYMGQDWTEKIVQELLGGQVTVIGLLLVVAFEGVFLYPIMGLVFVAVGASVFLTALEHLALITDPYSLTGDR